MNGNMELTVVVPANTTASVTLSNTTVGAAREGGKPLAGLVGVRAVRAVGRDVVVDVGSGRYMFTTVAN